MLATVPQFIDFVGREEAIQLTQVDNPDTNSVDVGKVATALNQAQKLLSQKVSPDWELFGVAQVRLARWLLDPYSTREVVLKGYNEAWDMVNNRPKPISWT